MKEDALTTVLGVCSFCNTGAILIHAIDYSEDRVLASINGEGAEWRAITEQYTEAAGEMELGFTFGSLFIPFAEVMRA